VPVQISGALLHNDNRQKIEGAVIVLHDLTDRLHQERQDQYISFKAGAADTGASVLHNLGNTLTGLGGMVAEVENKVSLVEQISAATETMNQRVKKGELEAEHVYQALEKISRLMKGAVTGDEHDVGMRSLFEQLRAELHRMGVLIKSYHGTSKETGERSYFNLYEALSDAVNLAGLTGSQQRFESSVECDSSIEIFQYRNQLLQVLLHLLRNSVDAVSTYQSGNPNEPCWIKVSAVKVSSGSWVEIKVEDSGCGVDPQLQSQLFASGYSTKGGNGQGLHYLANYVKKEKGEFSFESTGVNQGAVVQIRLPVELPS